MAAKNKKERQELLSVGPFCMINGEEPVLGEEGQPLLDRLGNIVYAQVPHYCSPNATRTQRSGVTDVEYMIRPDREYWLVFCNLNHTHTRTHTHARTHTHTRTHAYHTSHTLAIGAFFCFLAAFARSCLAHRFQNDACSDSGMVFAHSSRLAMVCCLRAISASAFVEMPLYRFPLLL